MFSEIKCDMEDFERIAKARNDAGLSQQKLAERTGVTRGAVTQWESGKAHPRLATLKKIAAATGVTLAWLQTGQDSGDEMSVSSSNGRHNIPEASVPQIDVTAGMGGGGIVGHINVEHNGITVSADQVSGLWGLPEFIYARIGVPAKRLAALPVQGDSMVPTLRDGDVIFVDTGHRSPSPDGIYALADDFGGVVVKRLESHGGDGKVRIISDNPLHQTYERSIDEMFIFGRYVGRWTV